MSTSGLRLLTLGLLSIALAFAGCGSDGVDGRDGADGEDGAPGPTAINASQMSDEALAGLELKSEILGVVVASPPVVTFALSTADGVPITGIVPYWVADDSFVRFTMTKLVPGTSGDPDSWVAYTRDDTTREPDYDKGSALVDNGDGTYDFTFNTDVMTVPEASWEPTLTHRVAGQMGSRSVPLEPQNFVYEYVPAGGAVTTTRKIAVMESCNECHDDLVFHGRRFLAEYCVNCHNPDLTDGEGDFAFMIHKIHNSGVFVNLKDRNDNPYDYSEVTYPQDLANCRKCHDGGDAATPDGDNWKNVPHMTACDGCHEGFNTAANHVGGVQADNQGCAGCHPAASIERYHTTANATPNNPRLIMATDDPAWVRDQRNITYELISADVDDGGTNNVTIVFRILSDGTPLDMNNLPQDLADPGRWPGFLLAYALPQGGIDEPQDYNNMGREGAQPISVSLEDVVDGTSGLTAFDAGSGENTAVITDAGAQFPVGATLRAVGLQGYFQQDLTDNGDDDVSLHTPSAVIAVTDDDERRIVVDNNKCAQCHEWFEGHGGNRTLNIAICTLCHVPNLSSSGRTTTDPTELTPAEKTGKAIADAVAAGTLDPSADPTDPLTWPEDAQNLKDLVHGIHSHGFRTRPFQHVRGPTREGYYDWEHHITFPHGASTSNCTLCHEDDPELPLPPGLLATTVRTTGVANGMDATVPDAQTASENVPNPTDWVNTTTASSCFYCHTSADAMAHMLQNGALLSLPEVPVGIFWSNRSDLGTNYESCAVCHGPGKMADLQVVHNK